MPIGSLIVKIGANVQGIKGKSKEAAGALGGVGKSAQGLNTVLKAMAIGLVARQLKQMVSSAMDTIDASAKMSRQLGGTIDGLEGLKLAASEAGVSTGALKSGIEMLNRRLGEAARMGSGQAYDALDRLGLKAEELSAMDIDERMASLSDAMRQSGYSTQQMADTMGQLGIRSGEITRLMMEGGDAIRDASAAIDDLGISISAVDAAKVEAANDAMDRAKTASTGFARAIAVEVSPLLTALSKKFVDASKNSKELAKSVSTTAKWIGKAAGFIGDSLRGVHIIFKTLELGGWALNTAFLKIFQAIHTTVTQTLNTLAIPLNGMIRAFNAITKSDVIPVDFSGGGFEQALNAAADAATETTKDVARQLKDLATKDWPSDRIQKFFDEVSAEAEKTAVDIAEKRKKIAEAVAGTAGGSSEADEKEDQKLKDKYARQLEMLREHTMSQEQLLISNHQKRLDQLRTLLDAEEVTKAEYRTLEAGLEQKHMEELAKIRKDGTEKMATLSATAMAGSVNTMIGLAASLAEGMDKESRTAFDLQKAAAISSAVISGAQGVAQTYGAFPFPINIPFAAAHAGLAAAQVAMIASKQFKGGSSAVAAAPPAVPTPAGGSASTGATAGGVTGGQGTTVNVSAQGDYWSRQSVLSFIDVLNDAVGDGARILAT